MSPKAILNTLLLGVALMFSAGSARAGLVLTLDNLSIVGAPGDVFNLTGSVTNSSGTLTEDFASANTPTLSSGVLQVVSLSIPDTLTVDQSYVGQIISLMIPLGTTAGSYPGVLLGISYESINGRTFGDTATLSVEVQSSAVVPEPATWSVMGAGLLLLGVVRARRAACLKSCASESA